MMMVITPPPFATQLQDEIAYGDNGMFRKYLVKDQKRQAMLICLQAGIHIPEHISAHDGFITVIQGRGMLRLAGQEVALEPGVFIELPANTLHALTVIENLAMLKVVDSHAALESDVRSKNAPCQDRSRKQSSSPPTCAESLVAMLKPYLQGSTRYRIKRR
jgi:quercetin dioxygenase-like cupin family protein